LASGFKSVREEQMSCGNPCGVSSRARSNKILIGVLAAIGTASLPTLGIAGDQAGNIFTATLQESSQKTREISTDELKNILVQKNAVVLDARPHQEYAAGHIPGAVNVAAKPGVPASQYVSDVAEIGRLVNNDIAAPLVLYCNGPFCGKSKRLSSELIDAGYVNIRRYQLGMPVWRALGGVGQIELDGLLHILSTDRTAVFLDVREREEFQRRTLPGARGLPRSGVVAGKDEGEIKNAKDDGRLPMDDHNTRIIVFGRDGDQARFVAEAVAQQAFHNVAFYGDTFDDLMQRVSAK
jgi:rhodanese-related sulfurtransferase